MKSEGAAPDVVDSQGMNYLVSLPRRVVTVYLPLVAFLVGLLFPFYWMVVDWKSTRLNSSHIPLSRMPSSA